jgi:hypothetical protein
MAQLEIENLQAARLHMFEFEHDEESRYGDL